MSQVLAIAKNTYLQTLRHSLFGVVVLITMGCLAISPAVTGWTLDDDNKMLRDIGLSTLLIQGLFLACLAASGTISTEIDDKTALTAVAKPVSRFAFVLGKYLGILLVLATAHYLAGIAFFMAMRHGVLQTAVETSDLTVIIFGVGVFLLLIIAATVLNYAYEYRFLPTLLTLAIPFLGLSSLVLLVIDRDWKLQSYEITQTMDNLPPEAADPAAFRGLITFRPLPGHQQLPGHRGLLVRKIWQGPLSEADQHYLEGLSPSLQWKKDVGFLAQNARKLQGFEIFKAALLVYGTLLVLAGLAVAVSTRLGMMSTFLVCLIVLGVGLSIDQILNPAPGETVPDWLRQTTRILPHFQFFWMVDALSEYRVIPWSYVGYALGYAAVLGLAATFAAAALFETREVG